MILATDCDREGQLIGQEILEHLRFGARCSARCSPPRTPRRCAGLRQPEAQPRVPPPLRGRRRAPAGRPDLQPVADPHRDPGAGRRRRQGRHRHRPGQDAHAGHRLPARDRDPGFPARGLFRDRRDGQGRGWHASPAPRAAAGPRIRDRARAEAIAAAAEGFRGPLAVDGRASAAGAAAAVRPAVAAEDLRPALGLDGGEDPCRRAGALRRRGQEAHHLPARRGPLSGREPDRRRAGDRRRPDAAARLRALQIGPPVIRRGKSRPLLRQGARRRVAPRHGAQRQRDGRPRGAHRPPQRRREAAVRPDLPLLPGGRHAGLRVPPDHRADGRGRRTSSAPSAASRSGPGGRRPTARASPEGGGAPARERARPSRRCPRSPTARSRRWAGPASRRSAPSRRRATTRARWSTPCRTPGASSRTRRCASG